MRFRGFDSSEGRELPIAGFTIDKLDRFTHFKGRDLDVGGL